MKWSERFGTGIAEIDQQHKTLFRMSEDLRATLSEGRGERVYGVWLDSLAQYAQAHFGFEERCMYRYQCPVAEVNSRAHSKFVEAVGQFRERYAAKGFNRADAQQLVQYIDDWLANHIGRIDTQLKTCVEQT
jgi:hemerythrin